MICRVPEEGGGGGGRREKGVEELMKVERKRENGEVMQTEKDGREKEGEGQQTESE